MQEDWEGICVEVINAGFLSATVEEVGLLMASDGTRIVPEHRLEDGTKLPRKLEPRQRLTAYVPGSGPGFLQTGLPDAKCAYARTACGCIFRGASPILRY